MLPVSVGVKVNGLHGDVRVKGVPVEQDSATGVMSVMEKWFVRRSC